MDLIAFDFALKFNALEAASLICGVDPEEGVNDAKVGRVVKVIHRDYEEAIYCVKHYQSEAPETQRSRFLFPWRLRLFLQNKIQIFKKLQSAEGQIAGDLKADLNALQYDIERYIEHDENTNENQVFEREELHRWLAAKGQRSLYNFAVAGSGVVQRNGRWPWGDHHTKLLGYMEETANKFWLNYDPKDKKNTAPKREVIWDWLINERGLSENTAKAIASILRADDLSNGPRK